MREREIRYVHHRGKPVDILPDEAVAAIKDATAEVLWRTGIQVRSESLLKQLGAAGAEIDTEDERARFPKYVQAGALESVPHDLPLRSREPGLDLILDGTLGAGDALDQQLGTRADEDAPRVVARARRRPVRRDRPPAAHDR